MKGRRKAGLSLSQDAPGSFVKRPFKISKTLSQILLSWLLLLPFKVHWEGALPNKYQISIKNLLYL